MAQQRSLQNHDSRVGAAAFHAAPTAMAVVDARGRLRWANTALSRLLGLNEEGIDGAVGADLVHPDDTPRLVRGLAKVLSGDSTRVSLSVRVLSAVDGFVPVRVSAAPLDGPGAHPEDMVVHVTDLRQRRAHARELSRLARRDPVTGLPARQVVVDDLVRALATNPIERIAVHALDLDRFHVINDRFGHVIGDQVLRMIASRLRGLTPVRGLARVGADEFVLVTDHLTDDAAALRWADTLIDAVRDPIRIDGARVDLSATVGVARAQKTTDDAEELVRHAGIALHRARERGQVVLLAEDNDTAEAIERLRIESDLVTFLRDGRMEIAFQPIHRVSDNTVIGVEALLRWPGSDDSPAALIALAEESNLISEVGMWVLEESLAALPGLSRAADRELRLSVNLSAKQLQAPDLAANILNLLSANGLPGTRLCVEVTETAVMVDHEQTIAVLNQLRDHGVTVAMDDFGIGYSSFSSLRDLPVDEVKIDRSFVRGLNGDAAARQIVDGMVSLCGGLGMAVTAEGVEDGDHLHVLRDNGCDRWQGFLSTPPLRLNELLAHLTDSGQVAAVSHRDGLKEAAAALGFPDVLVFQRVSDGRYAHIGGVGRGESWAGIVEIELPAGSGVLHRVLSGELVVLASETSQHIVGPYYARHAVLGGSGDTVVVLGNQHEVGKPVASEGDLHDVIWRAAAEITHVSPAKPLADELEVLAAVQGLLHFSGTGQQQALQHLLDNVVEALSCEVGIAWRDGGGAVAVGLEALEVDALMAVMASDGPLTAACVQDAYGDPVVEAVSSTVVRAWYVLPMDDRGGFVLVAHTDQGPRGFTSLCQRLGRTLVRSAGALFDAAEARERLERQASEAAQEARTDALTGVGNRLAWEEALAVSGIKTPLSVLMVDVNDFKSLNDLYGHAAGDTVLRTISACLREAVGDAGTIARVGGDEFGVLLPGANEAVAAKVVAKLHAEVARSHGGSMLPFSISLGHATTSTTDGLRDAIGRADAAMYVNKRGRAAAETLA